MKHTIELPAVDKVITVGQYVGAIRVAKAHPDEEFKHGLTCWWPCTGAEIMRQFRAGVRDRAAQRLTDKQLPRYARRSRCATTSR